MNYREKAQTSKPAMPREYRRPKSAFGDEYTTAKNLIKFIASKPKEFQSFTQSIGLIELAKQITKEDPSLAVSKKGVSSKAVFLALERGLNFDKRSQSQRTT
jgi:hypothetical protein